MNVSAFRVTAIVALASLVALSGCKNRNNGNGAGEGDEFGPIGAAGVDTPDLGATEGSPFDTYKERATDVSVQPLYFGYDSFTLPQNEIVKIQQAIAILQQNPSYVLIVEGHCDERGSNEYNLSLGEQRALAVRDYIVGGGIDAGRIQSRSYGEERPAVQGSGEEVWRLNRRGEFAFYK